MKMKKLLAILMAATLSLGALAACGQTAAPAASSAAASAEEAAEEAAEEVAEEAAQETTEAGGGKVGVCLPARDQYWTTFETNLKADLEAAGYEEVQIVVAGDQGEDVSTQMGQVETFANNGFDAVVIGMATGGSAADFLQRTGDMKVVFFNRAAEEGSTDGTTSVYIGMAEYDAGKAQGEWLANYFDEKGADKDLVGMMFLGVLGQDSVTNRTQGAKDALEAAGYNVTWDFEQTGEWMREKAMNLFTQYAGTGAEFDLVCCNNDDMALGVIEALQGQDIDFPIVGVDATEPGLNAVKEGTLAMTVDQDPQGQAVIVTQAITDLLAGKTLEPSLATPANPVTSENVEEVFNAKFGG